MRALCFEKKMESAGTQNGAGEFNGVIRTAQPLYI
jgi:hypothetical protein